VIGDWRSPAFHEDGDMGLKRYITRLVKDVDVVIVGTRLTMEVVGYDLMSLDQILRTLNVGVGHSL